MSTTSRIEWKYSSDKRRRRRQHRRAAATLHRESSGRGCIIQAVVAWHLAQARTQK